MAWRIPSARCPRCGAEVQRDNLEPIPVEWALADEGAATLWPRGQADVPASIKHCVSCRNELRGLYEDNRRWDREAQLSADDGDDEGGLT